MNRFFLIIFVISIVIMLVTGLPLFIAILMTGTITYNPPFGLLLFIYMISLAGYQKTKKK